MTLNCIFMGTPDISIPVLNKLLELNSINLFLVVSMPDRKAGRGKKLKKPEVAQFAIENDIPLIQDENINKSVEFQKFIENNKIDIIIVYAFAQFLNKIILNTPSLGCFNFHTSLLPKYRGAAPIQYAILNGDKKTGITIQKMVMKMDAGEIVKSITLPILENDNYGTLYEKLKDEGGALTKVFIDSLINKSLTSETQNETDVTFAPTIRKDRGLIDFKNKTNIELFNQIRAFNPSPGSYFFLGDIRIKVLESELSTFKCSAGEVNISMNSLIVGCYDGSIRLSIIQPESKKPCSDFDFLNGVKNKPPEFLIKEREN